MRDLVIEGTYLTSVIVRIMPSNIFILMVPMPKLLHTTLFAMRILPPFSSSDEKISLCGVMWKEAPETKTHWSLIVSLPVDEIRALSGSFTATDEDEPSLSALALRLGHSLIQCPD